MSVLVLLGFAEGTVDLDAYLVDVAALLHARTNAGGTELGVFNDETRPTGEEVIKLIEMAAGDLDARITIDVPDKYADAARRLVALQAASLVESSYFPNELDSDRSGYRQFTAMYLNGVDALIRAVSRPHNLRLV